MNSWMETDCPYCGNTNTTWIEFERFNNRRHTVVECGEPAFNNGCKKPYVVTYIPQLLVEGVNAIAGVG